MEFLRNAVASVVEIHSPFHFEKHAQEEMQEMIEKRKQGFATMDKEKHREIASKAGKAAHAKGTAHKFTLEQAREAGRKGGLAAQRKKREQKELAKKLVFQCTASSDLLKQPLATDSMTLEQLQEAQIDLVWQIEIAEKDQKQEGS